MFESQAVMPLPMYAPSDSPISATDHMIPQGQILDGIETSGKEVTEAHIWPTFSGQKVSP